MKPAGRDWLPVGISVISLAVSLVTFYINALLQVDDVRVMIGDPPYVSTDTNGDTLIEGGQQFSFINSGNRSAAVTTVSGLSRRLNPAANKTCASPLQFQEFPIILDAQPFVLKPSEIVVTTPTMASKKDRRGAPFRIPKSVFSAKVGDQVLICLNVNVVTPDNTSSAQQIPLYILTFLEVDAEPTLLFDPSKPIVLLKSRRFF
ncbi:hypothetical protein [Bradyrhizobium sp. AZCC 2230]|uniref:hypothetical protein n=1 Tax=Bradyrhizobium sp. AZCC 2230 TaxID=3117021 RepID=UPI002FEF4D92